MPRSGVFTEAEFIALRDEADRESKPYTGPLQFRNLPPEECEQDRAKANEYAERKLKQRVFGWIDNLAVFNPEAAKRVRSMIAKIGNQQGWEVAGATAQIANDREDPVAYVAAIMHKKAAPVTRLGMIRQVLTDIDGGR